MAMKKVVLDGIDYEAPAEVVVAFEKALTRATNADAALTAEKANKDAVQAKLDSATADLEAARAVDVNALVQTRIAERTAIETEARKVLGSEEKLDGLTDAEIRTKVIAKAYPTANLDGKSAEYVQSRFDAAIESVATRNDDTGTLADQRKQAAPRADACDPKDASSSMKRMHADMASRWKGKKAE